MLAGKVFRMKRSTLALGTVDGHREAGCIPEGDVVRVVSGPSGEGNQVVEVLWDGRVWTMFAIDLDTRGSQIEESQRSDQSASA